MWAALIGLAGARTPTPELRPATVLDHFQLALHTTADVDFQQEEAEFRDILDHAWDGTRTHWGGTEHHAKIFDAPLPLALTRPTPPPPALSHA